VVESVVKKEGCHITFVSENNRLRYILNVDEIKNENVVIAQTLIKLSSS